MGHFVKTRTLVNPGKKRKRKMSPKQIAIFGTKRQKAALRNSRKRKNPGKKARMSRKVLGYMDRVSGHSNTRTRRGRRKQARRYAATKRSLGLSNPSRILTLSLPNPGKKRKSNNMARRKRSKAKRVFRRRRHVANPVRRRRRTRRVTNYRRRRRNPSTRVVYRTRRHHSHRRRNPSRSRVMGGFGKVAGIFGGAAVTHIALGMLPASLTTGFIGYVTTAAVAMVQGKVVGGVLKNRALGNNMVTGGLVYLGLKVIGDLFPSIGAYLPFSLRGMGLIAPSSFYVPQVNAGGSMGTFIPPAASRALIPVSAGMRGINTPYPFAHNTRRTGRVS